MTGRRSGDLLASLPRELARVLHPHAETISRAIVDEVRRTVPAYARSANSVTTGNVVETVGLAVRHCIDRIGDPRHADRDWFALFRQRGRLEFGEGRTLDALQTAAMIGGRVAWRYISAALNRGGFGLADAATTAEAIFAYVDELSASALEGYHEARTQGVDVAAQRRHQLLELIVSAPDTSKLTIAGLAEAAAWPVPEQFAVIALRRSADARLPADRLPPSALATVDSAEPCLLSTDPVADLSAFDGQWENWRAAVSPPVALDEAPAALRTARRALALLGDGPVIWCQDHLATLWLLSEGFLADELAKRSLDPFDTLTGKQRERLSETLLAWLETRGGAPEVAKRLDVHPQTVRARLHQLEGLFGDRLRNPDSRLDMQLALRAKQLSDQLTHPN
ncbi:helix-turn-helix domain-containing protein [Amycolatopsis minnesotensis]|uniref:PucR family transcriptional regulator n=1 Tax=Amycolatopsis minnesotensis TaxID=337894 RepID=A0ABN2S9A6_9PSEU